MQERRVYTRIYSFTSDRDNKQQGEEIHAEETAERPEHFFFLYPKVLFSINRDLLCLICYVYELYTCVVVPETVSAIIK